MITDNVNELNVISEHIGLLSGSNNNIILNLHNLV